MTWIVATVALALLVPLFTRGSYARLLRTRWRWSALLLLGLGIQVALELVDIPEDHWHDLGFGLLVASYVLLVGFCCANLVHRGMGVVLIGVALNAIAITANQGMPVDAPASWLEDHPVEQTIKHHPQDPDQDVLLGITDIVPVPGPWPTVVSFGDLIMTVGLIDVAYHASRRGRRAAGAPRLGDGVTPSDEPRRDVDGPPKRTGDNGRATSDDEANPLSDLLFGAVPDSAADDGELLVRDAPPEGIDDAPVVEVPGR
jgi:hypothetical protein